MLNWYGFKPEDLFTSRRRVESILHEGRAGILIPCPFVHSNTLFENANVDFWFGAEMRIAVHFFES